MSPVWFSEFLDVCNTQRHYNLSHGGTLYDSMWSSGPVIIFSFLMNSYPNGICLDAHRALHGSDIPIPLNIIHGA